MQQPKEVAQTGGPAEGKRTWARWRGSEWDWGLMAQLLCIPKILH